MRRLILALVLLFLPASLHAQDDEGTVIVAGIVSELATAYKPGILSDNWDQQFSLMVWRKGDGPVHTTEMWVRFSAETEAQLEALAERFSPNRIVRFTIEGDIVMAYERPTATVLAPLSIGKDDALIAAARQVLAPPPIVDPDLGEFEPIEDHPEMFGQQREWLGREVSVVLNLDMGKENRVERTLASLRKAWDERVEWDKQARKDLAENFYELWRDDLRPKGDPVLSQRDFEKRLKIVGISCFADGAFDLFYEAEGLPDFPVTRFEVWEDGTTGTEIP